MALQRATNAAVQDAPFEKPKLNKTTTVLSLASVVSKTAGRAIDSPFRSKQKKARTYRRDVAYKLLRHLLSEFDAAQGQWVLPGTDAVYKYTARRKKWKAHTVELEHGAKGHWMGHSDAKYVLLFFHGGGYIAPSTPGHMKYQFALQKYLRKQGVDASVLSLSYVLAPKALHPMFIKQALSALQYLVDTMGRDPSTIILVGDSAGGNMVSSLLLHLARPHPGCLKYKLATRLRGALLISPWISFSTEEKSVTRNAHSDYLSKKALEYGRKVWVGPNAELDAYCHPVDAPVEWWKDVADKVVDEMLIWGGGGELLIDGIKKFSYNVMSGFEDAADVTDQKNELLKMMTADVKKLHPDVHLRARLIISPDEAHEEPIINHLFYIKKEDDGGVQIKKWLNDTLKNKPKDNAQSLQNVVGTAELKEEAEAQKAEDVETNVSEGEKGAEGEPGSAEAERLALEQVETVKSEEPVVVKQTEPKVEEAKAIDVVGNKPLGVGMTPVNTRVDGANLQGEKTNGSVEVTKLNGAAIAA